MKEVFKNIFKVIVIAILILVTINAYFRVGQGPDAESKGIIYHWLTK